MIITNQKGLHKGMTVVVTRNEDKQKLRGIITTLSLGNGMIIRGEFGEYTSIFRNNETIETADHVTHFIL